MARIEVEVTMAGSPELIGIADAIANLRSEIIEARERGKDSHGVAFSVREIEVELQVLAKTVDTGQGKVSVSWFLFGGEASYKNEFEGARTHLLRMKLHLEDAESGEAISLSR